MSEYQVTTFKKTVKSIFCGCGNLRQKYMLMTHETFSLISQALSQKSWSFHSIIIISWKSQSIGIEESSKSSKQTHTYVDRSTLNSSLLKEINGEQTSQLWGFAKKIVRNKFKVNNGK